MHWLNVPTANLLVGVFAGGVIGVCVTLYLFCTSPKDEENDDNE